MTFGKIVISSKISPKFDRLPITDFLPIAKLHPNFMFERNPNITILQIRYGYLHRIAFLNLLSNHRPEKCGFEKIKGANL
jgi:hypothetical protein